MLVLGPFLHVLRFHSVLEFRHVHLRVEFSHLVSTGPIFCDGVPQRHTNARCGAGRCIRCIDICVEILCFSGITFVDVSGLLNQYSFCKLPAKETVIK